MRRWFSRFGFSFILLSVVFAWEAYRIRRGDYGADAPQWKAYALFAAAAVCFALGIRAVRERHRALDDYRDQGNRDEGELR